MQLYTQYNQDRLKIQQEAFAFPGEVDIKLSDFGYAIGIRYSGIINMEVDKYNLTGIQRDKFRQTPRAGVSPAPTLAWHALRMQMGMSQAVQTLTMCVVCPKTCKVG